MICSYDMHINSMSTHSTVHSSLQIQNQKGTELVEKKKNQPKKKQQPKKKRVGENIIVLLLLIISYAPSNIPLNFSMQYHIHHRTNYSSDFAIPLKVYVRQLNFGSVVSFFQK